MIMASQFLSGGLGVMGPKVRMGKIPFPDDFKNQCNGTLDPKDFQAPKGFGLGALMAEIRPF